MTGPGPIADECGDCERCRDCSAMWCRYEAETCPWCREDGAA